jgi:hypothetical protein
LRWWIRRWLKSSKSCLCGDDDDDGRFWREGFEGLREGKESLEGDESERLSIFLLVKPDSVQTRSKPSYIQKQINIRPLWSGPLPNKPIKSPQYYTPITQALSIFSCLLDLTLSLQLGLGLYDGFG